MPSPLLSSLRSFSILFSAILGAQGHSAGPNPGATGQAPPRPAAAQASAPGQSPGDSLTIAVITMGPGEAIEAMFGHDAILIHDAATGTDSVYNWGVFDMSAPYFLPRFLRGRMWYSTDGTTLGYILRLYRFSNRTVWMQSLNLTASEKLEIRDFIRWNERPENAHYNYDYFRDNCATRVRDILDHAVGGAVRAQLITRMTGTTYRSQALRLMQSNLPLVTGVDIGLGRPTDHELSAWEESFLPERLMIHLRDVTLDGGSRRLVSSESVLFQATRDPEPTEPPRLWMILLPAGLLIGAVMVWLVLLAESGGRGTRITAAVLIATWSLVAGLVGTVLTLLWTVTDHMAAHSNENVMLLHPLWLVVAVALPLGIVRGRVGAAARGSAVVTAASVLLAIAFHMTMLSRQGNWAIIALVAPPALAVGWAAIQFRTRAVGAPS